jgi:hypothetical protein
MNILARKGSSVSATRPLVASADDATEDSAAGPDYASDDDKEEREGILSTGKVRRGGGSGCCDTDLPAPPCLIFLSLIPLLLIIIRPALFSRCLRSCWP